MTRGTGLVNMPVCSKRLDSYKLALAEVNKSGFESTPLGEGSYGSVWTAHVRKKTCAVKIVQLGYAGQITTPPSTPCAPTQWRNRRGHFACLVGWLVGCTSAQARRGDGDDTVA